MYAIIAVAVVLLMVLLVYGFVSDYMLKTEFYTINTGGKEKEHVRIVMIADLHGTGFGTDNVRLIKKIKEQKPDIICMAGDMTVKNGKGTDSCLALCKKLVSVCPVYYAPGNHEIRMENYKEYVTRLQKAGVNWLDNKHKSVYIREKKITVYGLDMEEYYYHKFWQRREVTKETIQGYLGQCAEEGIHVLLAHNPEYFEAYCEWGADLILSGHVHGGIAKLPLLGGVIDPALRLFPKYDSGVFQNNRAVMILTRGLGTHHIRLRFFNIPEISVINIF